MDIIHHHPDEASACSRYEIWKVEALKDSDVAEISVEVLDAMEPETSQPIACRVIVTASDGSHPDGGDQGVYADGRFFCEGRFTVIVPPGATEIRIEKGFSYIPLSAQVTASAGQRLWVRVWLHRWFAPEDRGWYGGDNHVHSQHDVTAMQKTGLYYTALQGRANGLSYITESGSHVSYENLEQWSTDEFLLKYASELGEACYTGHLITPGLSVPLSREQLQAMGKAPLFTQSVVEAAHRQGAAVIYTHPLTPPYQMHWMGATEAFSDAVLGRCADLFDVDSRATELFWFTLLNLGNRIGCSSYTDSTLERMHTLTPGDRRVYCHSGRLDYDAIVDALRHAHTFASNGPLFTFLSINDAEPGDTIQVNRGEEAPYRALIEIHSLYPLERVQLFRKGNVVAEFQASGEAGRLSLEHLFTESDDAWYVLKSEDVQGHWCITSPIYFESSGRKESAASSAIVFEISNHTRFSQLTRHYFAHVLATVSPGDGIEEVELIRDGATVHCFKPETGNHTSSGRTPVTESELGIAYEPGWLWYPDARCKLHFQLDYPVTVSGEYAVRMKTSSGRIVVSDTIVYQKNDACSQSLSLAHLRGNGTEFTLWGYGEEAAIETLEHTREDRWWYPGNPAWRIVATFDGQMQSLQGGRRNQTQDAVIEESPDLVTLFKTSEPSLKNLFSL